jgi:hypothetical protein
LKLQFKQVVIALGDAEGHFSPLKKPREETKMKKPKSIVETAPKTNRSTKSEVRGRERGGGPLGAQKHGAVRPTTVPRDTPMTTTVPRDDA